MNKKRKVSAAGIVFNSVTAEWEVYGTEMVVRDGRRVPNFTADSFGKAATYAMEVEGWR